MYEITIKKIESVPTVERGRYTVVDKRPYTNKELESANDIYRACYEKLDPKAAIKEVMGYAPDEEVMKEITVDVLTQRVDDLDLAAVIKAVNKL